jgi:hypothetical protein
MGAVERAIQRIEETRQNGDEVLSLNNLRLTAQDLEMLVPRIASLPQLEELDLSENSIAAIPDNIAQLSNLQILTLEENDLQNLPQSLTQLSNLRIVNLKDNDFDEFPQLVMQLPALEHVDLSTNHIESVLVSQDLLRSLGDRTIDLTDNPLTEEARNYINEHVPDGNIETDLAADEEAQDIGEVLNAIYPENSQVVKSAIDNLAYGAFTTAKTKARKKDAGEVLNDFLSKTPYEGTIATQIYLPVAKGFLDTILNPDVSQEDKSTELQKMATALGNCSTPVKSFLIQNAVDKQIRDSATLSPLMENLLDREAVEDKINTALKGVLKKNEKIEQVQGLVNSLFLEGAENYTNNKLKITGNRARLESKTANIEFAFEQIAPEAALAFAQLFCETDTDKTPAKNGSGAYVLDPAKLTSVTSAYRAKIGLLSNEERAVQEKTSSYKAEIIPLLQADNLTDNPTEEDVLALMDIPAQQEDLRAALFRVTEVQRDNAYEQFVEAQKTKIREVIQKYEPKKMGLASLTTPVNQGNRRPPSPDGGGKRKATPRSMDDPSYKRRRGPG